MLPGLEATPAFQFSCFKRKIWIVTNVVGDGNSGHHEGDHVEAVDELGPEPGPDSTVVVVAKLKERKDGVTVLTNPIRKISND